MFNVVLNNPKKCIDLLVSNFKINGFTNYKCQLIVTLGIIRLFPHTYHIPPQTSVLLGNLILTWNNSNPMTAPT